MAVPKSRIQDLVKLRCSIFGNPYNPLNVRTGNKILRQNLAGPAIASYYPPRNVTFKDLKRLFPMFDFLNEKESDRQDHLAIAKARGKGAPKKKRTAQESKTFNKRKKGGR